MRKENNNYFFKWILRYASFSGFFSRRGKTNVGWPFVNNKFGGFMINFKANIKLFVTSITTCLIKIQSPIRLSVWSPREKKINKWTSGVHLEVKSKGKNHNAWRRSLKMCVLLSIFSCYGHVGCWFAYNAQFNWINVSISLAFFPRNFAVSAILCGLQFRFVDF